MTDQLYVTIPLIIDNLNDNASLKRAISVAIMENQSAFHPLLERLIEMGDLRMTVLDDSLNIDTFDVIADDSGGIACGTFDSDFYAGCKDMNSVDEHEVELPFTIENNILVFNIVLPPAWIPDYD